MGIAELFLGFSAAFATQGEHLVPVVRDLVPDSTIILSPGRVWSEPGDGGMSRASFPFVLTNPHDNATHNGLATFLYDDTRISALRVQVVQETAPWAKYDGWGQAALTYTPGPIVDEAAVRAQLVAELQHQTPIQPWSALPVTSGTQWLEGFDGDTAPRTRCRIPLQRGTRARCWKSIKASPVARRHPGGWPSWTPRLIT
jgi:hypothetical protein